RFDLIIVDYHMPGMDGLQTIAIIRERVENSPEKLPVLLLHSSADDTLIKKACVELGVRNSLVKPVKARELHRLLASIDETGVPVRETPTRVTLQSEAVVASTKASRKITILIAEDVPMNMLLVKSMAKRLLPGAEILEAVTGLEAVQMALQHPVDLILMDVQMPEMDGLEATREIRTREERTGRRVPIVALTAGALDEERGKCKAAGMDFFLTKPLKSDALRGAFKLFLD
ncbi:MAG: response regulator, partial [Spirochaetales bacterium]|nr:response regulator [Spirochaetales bacterium]